MTTRKITSILRAIACFFHAHQFRSAGHILTTKDRTISLWECRHCGWIWLCKTYLDDWNDD